MNVNLLLPKFRLEAEGCPSSNLLPVVCDVTQMSDVQYMVDRAMETYGAVDVLINNAGCMYYQLMKNGSTKVSIILLKQPLFRKGLTGLSQGQFFKILKFQDKRA